MPVLRYFSSLAQPTTLAGGISSANATIQVAATIGFPTSFPYTLSLDYGAVGEELVDVISAASTTLTVTRAVDGTSAQSHSIGAVVRHVASARDHADYQTHQAATAAVHGVTGTLVGTSDTQTLAAKTLTSPTINAATLSGTLSGAPTFSGTLLFTGAPIFRGALTTDGVLGTRVTGDTNSRLQIQADGRHVWGTGATTGDTNLYRSSADVLKTDDDLVVVGNLTAGNMALGAWSSWTPTWTTSTGLHLPSFGNAVISGTSVKVGRMLVFSLFITFGNTTSFGAAVTNGDNWWFSLPSSLTASAAFTAGNACGSGRVAASLGATAPVTVGVNAAGTSFTLDVAGGRADSTAITSAGSVDSLSPWTWAANNTLYVTGVVETTT